MTEFHFTFDQFLAIALFAVGSFVTWVVTYIYFKKAERKRQLCYSWDRDRLLSRSRSSFEGVEIKIDNASVISPYRMKLFVWNPGNETINGSEISRQDALRFGSNDIRIIRVEATASTRDAVNFKWAMDDEKNFINFEFDFLDENDGVMIEFLYDQSGKAWPNLTGTIKGMKGGPVFVPLYQKTSRGFSFHRYISGPSFALFMFTCAGLSFYDVWYAGFFAFTSVAKILAGIIFVIFGAIAVLISVGEISDTNQFAVPTTLIKKNEEEFALDEASYIRRQIIEEQNLLGNRIV